MGEFWMLLGPELLSYACSCGSVDSVKLLVNMKCLQHYERYNNNISLYQCLLKLIAIISLSVNDHNPLLCAAKHGKDETVQYLLDLNNQLLERSKVRAIVSSITFSLVDVLLHYILGSSATMGC
jgi:ankyrin repeat protein